MRVFPLVGAAIGLVGGLALIAFEQMELPPLAAGLLTVTLIAVLTGGLHEDGLADCADAFGAIADRERKFEILKDSRQGTFGVLALIFSVGVRAAILAAVPAIDGCWMLIGACALSRGAVPLVMAASHPARSDGVAASSGTPEGQTGLWSLGLCVAIAFLALGGQALAALAYAALAAGLVVFTARRQIGGYTGDVLGAVVQCVEIAVLIAGLA